MLQEDTAQPGSLVLRDGPVHTPPPRGLHALQFLAQPLGNRLTPHGPLPLPRLPPDMHATEEVEGLRLVLTAPLTPFGRKAPAVDQARLCRVQLQVGAPHTAMKTEHVARG